MTEVITNFVDYDFEQAVLALIPERKSKSFYRNNVLRYGSSIPYPDRVVSNVIPDIFNDIKDIPFDSVTINEYLPNQRIAWHTDDAKGGDVVYVVSLLSDANIEFTDDVEKFKLLLPRYSLLKFWGDYRYAWKHRVIAPDHRVSVVFRNSLL